MYYSYFIPILLQVTIAFTLFSSKSANNQNLFNPIINTSSGIYEGHSIINYNRTVHRFLGIQYAKGKRFHKAIPIRKNNSNIIIQANKFGPVCKSSGDTCISSDGYCRVEYGIFTSVSLTDEDCLYLNLFIPISTVNQTWAKHQRKAILLWIHGGSGQVGSGNLFDGSIFASIGDVIVVTFNFRLNLYGFLSSGDDRLEGNIGLYDQLLVLDWLYENAEQFGGDRERIALGGHSAGGPHAHFLGYSPLSRGRIRRLIFQSGTSFNVWSHIHPDMAIERFQVVAIDNGCYYTQNDKLLDFHRSLDCLSKKDFRSLTEQEHYSYMSANHTNVVHQYPFLMSNQNETYLLDNVNYAKLDILMGSVADEGLHIAVVPLLMQHENQEHYTMNTSIVDVALKFLANMKPDLTCLYDDALKLYNINDNLCMQSTSSTNECQCSLYLNYSKLVSDILFYNDYYRYVHERLKKSSKKKETMNIGKTYLYSYTYHTSQGPPSSCNLSVHQKGLTGHFAELEYTWGIPLFEKNQTLVTIDRYEPVPQTPTYNADEIKFSEQLIRYWSSFIQFGDPNQVKSADSPYWAESTENNLMVMNLYPRQLYSSHISEPKSVVFWNNTCSLPSTKNMDKKVFDHEASYLMLPVILLTIALTVTAGVLFDHYFL